MRTYKLILIGLLPLMLAIAGCGGGGGGSAIATSAGGSGGGQTITPSGSNVVTMTVDPGPNNNSVDIPYITVTVCNPSNTSQCQTFDHIEVDTGSYGFRILADATDTSGNPYSLSLPAETDSSNNAIAECTQFVDGFSWGPVATADLEISGESAAAVPVQVIGDPTQAGESSFPPIPAACSGTGTNEDTVSAFGANGILGVGPFAEDCGSGCATTVNNGYYYICPAGGSCQDTALGTSEQVTNPVTYFTTDNNGVVIELPSISSAGETSASGSLVFGIDTEGDNALTAQNVLTADNNGDITTQFDGQSLPYSVFDTGSNAYYFNDSAIPTCPSPNSSWFCPSSTLTLNPINYGVNSSSQMTGTSSPVTIYVANADSLFSNIGYSAFNDIAGSSGDQTAICGSSNCSFDFGLPFFFGRNVYVAIAGAPTSAGNGPFYAY